ncbi:hypothetical protein Tco_1167561, partial [Tanacetum coccineum]
CERRGFSFIHTLLGIALNELHLYGDPAVVPLIQRLLSVNGNNVQAWYALSRTLAEGEMRSAETFSGFGLTDGDLLMMISSSSHRLLKKQFGRLMFSMALQAISVFKIGVNGGAGLMLPFVCRLEEGEAASYVGEMEENARLDLSACEGYGVRMHSDNIKVSNVDEVLESVIG